MNVFDLTKDEGAGLEALATLLRVIVFLILFGAGLFLLLMLGGLPVWFLVNALEEVDLPFGLNILLPSLVVLVAFAPLFAVAFYLTRRRRKRKAGQRRRLAERFGLEQKALAAGEGEPVIHGFYRGRQAVIYTELRQWGRRDSHRFTVLRVACTNPRQFQFTLEQKRFYKKKADLWSEFKRVFRASFNDAPLMTEVLTDSVQQRLLSLVKQQHPMQPTFALEGQTLAYAEGGSIDDEEQRARFETMLDLSCDVAETLDRAAGASPTPTRPNAARERAAMQRLPH